MDTPEIAKCDVCGEPATMGVRDSQEVQSPGIWRRFEPHGAPRFGCDKHPVKSVEYPLDTRRFQAELIEQVEANRRKST